QESNKGKEIWLSEQEVKLRSTLVDINGVPFPSEMINGWGAIRNFRARPDDLLICTYPKAGTTWIQEIVDMVLHGEDLQKCARAPIHERMPFIEMVLPKLNISGRRRVVQKISSLEIIYVARNAKDNVVSYFHFHRMNKTMPEPGTWEEFLEIFIAGKVSYGSWFDHVRGWWEAKDRHPILYLFYEDMKENPSQEIQKVAEFLDLQLPESVLNQIVQHTKFEHMKANPMTNYTTMPSSLLDHSISPFMRKGETKG
uniref:Sulfotransferase n=1 Tax=Anolis carolinensis TaxID=28377 RepID=A0A803U0I5_ANOCA